MGEKKKGIIETLKAASTENEVVELTKKISKFEWAADKTLRKFTKIARRKRVKFRTSHK